MNTQGFCVLDNEITSFGTKREGCRWLPLSNLNEHWPLINKSDVYFYLDLYRSGKVEKECLDYFFNQYELSCLGCVNFLTRSELKKIRNPDLALRFLKIYDRLDSVNGIQLICEKLRRESMKIEEKDVFVDDVELRGKNAGCYIEPRLKSLGLFNSLDKFQGSNERQTLVLLNLYTGEEFWVYANQQEVRSEIYKRYHRYVTQEE